ncbi:unnamed protein product [Hymenolepis diminuta]|uniref:Tektin n=1 Tax=Hymenolepis diminuta TaxID=6216 RepID=A0A564Z6A5_HYMDI|nr:unnamed protein product [Hymenolepis diminuta]
MATINKSRFKTQINSWNLDNQIVKNIAKSARGDLQDSIYQNAIDANCNDLLTVYKNAKSTNDLKTRFNNVSDVLSTLHICEEQVDEAISELNEIKVTLESNIQKLQEYENFNVQCLVLEDRRRGIDYVEDKIDVELRKEKEILQKNINLMQSQVDKIFEKILRLKEVRQKLLKDIEDKQVAKDIDLRQYHLTPAESSLKPNPTETPHTIVSIKEWEQYSRQNIYLSNKENYEAAFIYNESNQLIAKIGIEAGEQCKAVNAALRERIHDVNQVINQLKWEKKQTEYNIEITIREIDRLEGLVADELPRRKIAETRLENRKTRPGMELCDDIPHRQLVNEVEFHKSSRKLLKYQMEFYRRQLNDLNKALQRIEKDILLKTSTQELASKCLKMREEALPVMRWTKLEVVDPNGFSNIQQQNKQY